VAPADLGYRPRMRVFVLTTGRSGSVTFARACGHITNLTSAHESRAAAHGEARLDYPDDHVEVDNRLSWFLGPLAERFPEARYVHLVRDEDATARSFLDRWRVHPPPPRPKDPEQRARWQARVQHPRASLVSAFGNGLLLRQRAWPEEQRAEVARFMVETIHANIRTFLQHRPHLTVRLEEASSDFAEFWRWVGAEGDLEAALGEWRVRHNARPDVADSLGT
jgi:hypothetical protein